MRARNNNNTEIREPQIESNTLKQIITPQVKSDIVFQQKLADFCRGDASHDLGDTIKFTDAVLPVFNEALPYQTRTALSEPEILHSVILGLTGNNRTEKVVSLNNKLTTVPDVTINPEQAPAIINIGYVNNGAQVNLFTYNAVRFNIPSSTNVAANGPSCRDNFGKTFVTNTKLGTTEAALIVDFSQHHFMEKLVQGESSTFKIHYLMTPEVVNDPAGKPNVDNKTLFSTNTGVGLISYVQRDIGPVCYTPFTAVESNPLNNFFSKYDFTLSPIKQIFVKKSASQLVSTLDIKYIPPNSKPYTATIEDSKKQNSITSVLGYIKKIINGLTIRSSPQEKFNFNVKCQQKRGGDWFQVLCSLDARSRTYTRILPTPTTQTEQVWTMPEDCPVYFVSHDQIAVSYALLNGVNVIYIDYYGRIFVFKNSADPSLAGTGKPISEILFEGIKSRYVINTTRENFGFNELIQYSQNYTGYRNEIIDEEINTYNTVLNASRQTIQDQGLENRKNAEYMTIVTQVLKNIFTASVRLMFVKINLIDISKETAYVSENRAMFGNDYTRYDGDDASAKIIQKISDNINLIRGIIDKYGKIAASDANYKTNITNWITNNIRNLDVYRAANNLALENCGLDNKVNRIITFVNTQEQPVRFNDKYIFLPFIQTLSSNNDYSPPTNELNTLIELLNTYVKPSLDRFIENISQPTSTLKNIIKTIRTTRSGRDPNQSFYNCALNLIYEANILLKIEKNTEDNFLKESDVPQLESTDNIIMSEDDIEINEFKKGKMSNYSESEDNISRQQGGWTFAQLPEPGSRNVDLKSVVCDVSIRQMTWPLLTNIFVTNKTSYTAKKMIESYKKYLPDGRIPTTYEWLFATNNGSENYDFTNDPMITEINSEVTMLQRARDAITLDRVGEAGVLVASGFLGRIPLAVTVVSVALYETYKAVKGGADDDMSVTIPETPTEELLKDFTICYHPLMPIYMLLSPFFYTLGPKFESYPFFYTYFTYVNILEKMVDVLDKNYLNDPTNNNNILAAYFIGRTLGAFLFTSNTSLLQNDKILEMIGMSQEDYYDFSLKNDSFASLISGSIHLTPEEEVLGFVFLRTELFKNFINVEVNIKQIVEQGTPVEGLPSYMDLKDRIYNLIHRIVAKVNADRGTPLAAEIDDVIAAGIKIPDDAMNVDEQQPREETAMEIEQPIDIQKEDTDMEVVSPSFSRRDQVLQSRANKSKEVKEKATLARQRDQEQSLQKFKEWSKNNTMRSGPGSIGTNQFNALSRGIKGFGGKRMTKNRCKRKVCTRKKNVKNEKTSKKTIKHKRVHKRTRKNFN